MISFYPNCTLPTESRGFVASPNVRSTLDIVWSCVATLLLCCWSILHLNVPPQFQPATPSQKFCRALWLFQRKLKWVAITLLAPESILAKAVMEYMSARWNTRLIQAEFAEQDAVQWTKSHSFLADMGGFAVRFSRDLRNHATKDGDFMPGAGSGVASGPGSEQRELRSEVGSQGVIETPGLHARPPSRGVLEQQAVTQARSPRQVGLSADTRATIESALGALKRDILRPGLLYRKCGPVLSQHHAAIASAISEYRATAEPEFGRELSLAASERDIWVLTARQIYEARRIGLIGRLPSITEDEISDRSKGDWLVKALALLQISWLVVQVAVRPAYNKPTCPLEIKTLSFAVMAVIIYGFLLGHLKDVSTRTHIQAQRVPSVNDIRAIYNTGPSYLWLRTHANDAIPNNVIHSALREQFDYHSADKVLYGLCLYVGSAIFCGLHLVAWDFPFPTPADQIIWRAAALVAMLSPIVMPGLSLGFICCPSRCRGSPIARLVADGKTRQVFAALLFSGTTLMVLVPARLLLLLEVFRSLYYLPPDTYYSTWTEYVPHFK